MKCKISIIMPVYNVEDYIEQSIESVLKQRYEDYELIIIDDESTDNTLKKCEKYEGYSRIKILRQKHGHQAKARNLGIMEACGEYITFLDGDDFWETDYLEKLGQILAESSCDMCIGSQHYCWRQGEKTKHKLYDFDKGFSLVTQEEAQKIIFQDEGIPASMWLLICKKSFLEKNKIEFDEKLLCCEDFDFFMQGFFCAKTIVLMGYCFYNYRQDNIHSTYYNVTGQKLMDFMYVHKKWYDCLMGEDSLLNQKVLINIAKSYRWAEGMLGKINRRERKEVKKYLDATRYILGERKKVDWKSYAEWKLRKIMQIRSKKNE